MRWVHISDIHYHPSKDGRTTDELRSALIEYMVSKGIKADHLFITGDFRSGSYSGENEEVAKNVASYIKMIFTALGIQDIEKVHIVPGNHDLQRLSCQKGKARIKNITDTYDPSHGGFSDEDQRYLLNRFSFFRLVSRELYGIHSKWLQEPMPLHCVEMLEDCSILSINSAVSYNEDGDDRGKLVVGNLEVHNILKRIEKENPDIPIIFLAHNGINDFCKGDREVFEKFFTQHPIQLYLCGDAHETWQRTTNSQTLEITMGAMKHANGVESVFSQGEIADGILEIKGHIWNARYGSWAEYAAFNEELNRKIEDISLLTRRKRNMDIRRKYFCEDNLTTADRFFLIDMDNKSCESETILCSIVDLIKNIANKYSKISTREKNPFCPYIKLMNFEYSCLLKVKERLYEDSVIFCDGRPYDGALFLLSEIHKSPNSNNRITVKLLDERADIQSVILASPHHKQVYQFYCNQPFFKDVHDKIVNISFSILDYMEIGDII